MAVFKFPEPPPHPMGLEEMRREERAFSRKMVLIGFVWIAATVAAGTLLVVFRDVFAGTFF